MEFGEIDRVIWMFIREKLDVDPFNLFISVAYANKIGDYYILSGQKE
jgi:hypothetical protein